MGKDFNSLFFYKNGKKVKHLIDSTERSHLCLEYLPSKHYLFNILSRKTL
jgi:hypothetical protein